MLNVLVKSMVEEAIDQGVFPGANYAYYYQGKTYMESCGYKALYPYKERNHLDTVYDIASLTKVIGTTSAILKLLDDQMISLSDPVNKYLDFIEDDAITLEHLLTHCSGYPALTPGTEEMVRKEPLLDDLKNCKLEYKTGSQVVYSDVGFMYLGWVIDQMTGSYSKFIESHFTSWGMKDTCFNHKEILRIAPTENFKFRGLIRGFVHDEKSFLLDGIAGHAGLYSTVEDLIEFAKRLLSGSLFSEESMQVIQKKYIESDDDFRSIGWIVKTINDQEVIYHTGYTGTSILVDFKNDFALVLLSNRVHPTRKNIQIIDFRKKLEKAIYNQILGEANEIKR